MLTKRKVRMVVGVFVASIFGGLLTALLFKDLPEGNADIVKVLVGFIGGAFVTMVSFYFGDKEQGADE